MDSPPTIYEQLTIDDIGTDRWEEQKMRTGNVCFDTKINPPFPLTERSIEYGEDVYFLSTKECYKNCTNKGLCTLGRCTCMNGWHSVACDIKNCPNSLCFVDIDTIDP